MSALRLGGIEAGGTKFVCLVGTDDGRVLREERFPTRGPDETLRDVLEFFRAEVRDGGPFDGFGIAAFGPLELRRDNPAYGFIGTTPKPGWSGVDLVGPVVRAFGAPVGFDTDVNGAALAEGRWGAARDCANFVYVTVGTGIGGGAVVNGSPVHGLVHPEIGHVSVPRQDGDTFGGSCPFHGDCFEGMASGTAIRARWGVAAHEMSGTQLERAVDLEGAYLAAGCRNITYALAPERIIIGGGVVEMPGLLTRVRHHLTAQLCGYPGLPEQALDGFVVAAGLGRNAGPAGALALATIAVGTPE